MQTHSANDWQYIANPKNDLPDLLKQLGVVEI